MKGTQALVNIARWHENKNNLNFRHLYIEKRETSQEVDKVYNSNQDFPLQARGFTLGKIFLSELPQNLTKGSSSCVKDSLQVTGCWNNRMGLKYSF